MKVNQMFPSKYLSAADLQGRQAQVIMDRVMMEQIRGEHGNEDKYVLYFQGKEKGLVLNVTNANTIAEFYGHETEEWTGRAITLYSTRVQFGNRMVDAIRISRPQNNGGTAEQSQQSYKGNPNLPPSKQAEAMAEDGYGAELDDQIPF